MGDVVGLPPQPVAEEPIEIWDVNWRALQLFGACGTQWRIAVCPGGLLHLGLDYPGVDVVMRRLAADEADHAGLFADLQVMEAAALPVLNEAMG